jgi:putative ABC transport system substrate-binding protein
MRRRAFIAALGSAATWPLVARAQRPERVRRVGALMGFAEADPEAQALYAAFRQGLAALGWIVGSNLRADLRWGAGDINRASSYAKELVAQQPDVILAHTTPVTAAVQNETKAIPIVFVAVSDPIGSGFVESLARPGGNITGFINLEATLVEKWLELLKEIAPRTTTVAIMFNPRTAPYAEYYLKPLYDAAPMLGVTAYAAPVQSDDDIETVIANLARERGSGIISMTDSFMVVHRKLIIELTARHKIPAISFLRSDPSEGGLVSYGTPARDLFARAAPYVDRILRGAKPTDLPVQVPTKYELAINLKSAKALGLTIPPALLLRADEVIE